MFRAKYTVICLSVELLAKCAEQLESSEQMCACLAHNNSTVPLVKVHFIIVVVAERLSARHLHALGRCIFVRHAPYLAVTLPLYCPSRSSTHARKDDTRVHAFALDGGGERVHARPNAWAFARALDGRRGYGETSPSTSARAIDCARHMYAHSAYTYLGLSAEFLSLECLRLEFQSRVHCNLPECRVAS